MDLALDSRHALVCGASQGIGLASARELASLGARVTLLARSAERLQALAAELPGDGHGWIAVDTSDTPALAARAAELAAAGPVHILVNNSGGPAPGPLHATAPSAIEDAMRQHVVACQVLAQACVPGMRETGYGRIVNIISTSVKEPIPGLGVSNTARWAVAAWAKTLAGELGPDGITVNNVLPGYTDTPRIEQIIRTGARRSGRSEQAVFEEMVANVPLRRFARPEETAAAVAFLCSPAAAYISGVNLPVDGGRTRSS
ncbi:SDR family oxidoreductase [Lysobacter sp. GX 14042]|uniref:SDR family oxidoreductase n=1 Tax=Lysobacter sp. GX 14042 TaxID=2907155 RepID=UPI001F1EBDEC|nr:SDR family oxidoreductase [Lysobacter sp. GX 14042]MCE7031288.1 SDR family oxidoreductase [Lysobacter sp. GX 14042]